MAASFVETLDTRECLLDLLFVGGAPERDSRVSTFTGGRGQLKPEHMLEVLSAVGASAPEGFADLAQTVRARRASLSSLIVVLLAWDEPRRALLAWARGSGLQLRALLVCAAAQAPRAAVNGLLVVHPGDIERGLAGLR